MDPQVVQNLRCKLQKRIRRLNSTEGNLFIPALRQFFLFVDSNPTYYGITQLLMTRFPDLSNAVEGIFRGESLCGESEEEAAAIGYSVLHRLADEASPAGSMFVLGQSLARNAPHKGRLDVIRDAFLEPFYEYVDEQLDDQRVILGLLLRYKHRCEWFHRSRLWDYVHSSSQQAEKLLTLDLFSYLHDQGIDFSIEPSSPSGEIDLIANQGSKDPLLAEAKVFDADMRGKAHVRKGFHQIYTYTQQYNEPSGYLVIFKATDRDLRFSLSASSRDVPTVTYNNKTLFLLTIDISRYDKPVSKRNPLRAIEITEEELAETLADTAN